VVEYRDSLRKRKNRVQVVLDDHDRDVSGKRQQPAQGGNPLGAGEPGHGFVEEKRGGARRQREFKLENPLLAVSKCGGAPPSEVGKAYTIKPPGHLFRHGPLWGGPESPAAPHAASHREGDVFGHRQLAEKSRALECAPQAEPCASPCRKRGRVAFAEPHCA
jgi:hypothetical protein